MIFVLASAPATIDFDHVALHPYPRQPTTRAQWHILDSGAFGLSLVGRSIDEPHMHKMAEYYAQYPSAIHIAPDVFLNPTQTMANFDYWQKNIRLPVAPVIQFHKKKKIDVFAGLKQIDYYMQYPDHLACRDGRFFVCISNPGLTAIESNEIATLCRMIRVQYPDVWLHNLGAGWGPPDILRWHQMDCFDSIDSISYLTDAERGMEWHYGGVVHSQIDYEQLVCHNAQVAISLQIRTK